MKEKTGILCIDKPKGWTSFDCIRRIRRLLSTKKVGHAGTLDPLATGVLVVAVGECTRLLEYLTADQKTYEVQMELGKISTTYDAEGELTEGSARIPSAKEIQDVVAQFLGEGEQVPPQFSAVHVNGVRAYALARKGEKVEMPKRSIVVYEGKMESYTYPYCTLTFTVSKGTYIRSLVHDIGEALGVGAYITELKRTKSGTLSINETISLEDATTEELTHALKEPNPAWFSLPHYQLTREEEQELCFGRTLIFLAEKVDGEVPEDTLLLISPEGEVRGIGEKKEGRIQPKKMFLPEYFLSPIQ